MSAELKTIRDYTCLGCGCLCDDLAVTVADGAVVEVEPACPGAGGEWIRDQVRIAGELRPAAKVAGRDVGLEEGIESALGLIRGSRAALIVPRSISNEAMSQAVGLADRMGAAIDTGGSSVNERAFQRDGAIGATFGEIKDRADLVVVWSVELARDYPRFAERYLGEPVRRFFEGKRRVVEMNLPESTWTETFACLRVLIRGGSIDGKRLKSRGLDLEMLTRLAGEMTSARYGALIHGEGLAGDVAQGEAMKLVRDLNNGRRFVAIGLGRADNGHGIRSALTWAGGASGSVDFSLGHPRYLPGEVEERTGRGEVDLIVAIGEESPIEGADLPTLLIAPRATMGAAVVAIDAARTGIDGGGIVTRDDGVMLPTRPILEGRRPSVADILRTINARLDEARRS